MGSLVILIYTLVVVSAYPKDLQRIVGGSITNIGQYPEVASLLFSAGNAGFRQTCGGSILTNYHILTAAQCTYGAAPSRWRTRLGSSYANSGGVVFDTDRIINHSEYNENSMENDIAIIRLKNRIVFNDVMRPGTFAGSAYYVGEDQVVWAVGWGRISTDGPSSERLRHVQIYTINQATCRERYGSIRMDVTDNMLCAGLLDIGGHDQCMGDAGGPLFYNGHVAGIASWGYPSGCGDPWWPSVNVRLQRYPAWINANLS